MLSYTELVLVISLVGYLVGAIPSGYWFARYWHGIDITQHGSGNIGATNVARVLGSKFYFLLIFLLDALKAFCYLKVAKQVFRTYYASPSQEVVLLLCATVLIGNAYSIFLGFRGGKGVATMLGILAAVAPGYVTAVYLVSWLCILASVRRVGIASPCAMVLTTLMFYLFMPGLFTATLFAFLLLLNVWLFFLHSSNIKNFLNS